MMVYGGTYDGQRRVIVKARSRAAVVRALKADGMNITDHTVKEYGCATSNVVEIAQAQVEGEIWSRSASNHRGEWSRGHKEPA